MTATDLPLDHLFLGGIRHSRLDSVEAGASYDVFVALPPGYEAGERAYPLLLALDANYLVGTVVEAATLAAATGEGQPLIVAAIGTAGSIAEHTLRRLRDYLPRPLVMPTADGALKAVAQRILDAGLPLETGSGQAPRFLRCLQRELLPRLQADYRIDASDIGLLGHSGGGAFTAHALLERAEPFGKFIIGSFGACWWGDHLATAERAFAAASGARPLAVFHGAGEDELADPAFAADLATGAALIDRLAAVPGVSVTRRVFANASHASAATHVISAGLRCLWPGSRWGSDR